jgi:hypothetical protein
MIRSYKYNGHLLETSATISKSNARRFYEPSTFGNIIEQTILPTFVAKE